MGFNPPDVEVVSPSLLQQEQTLLYRVKEQILQILPLKWYTTLVHLM
jgi:hypothetical protein